MAQNLNLNDVTVAAVAVETKEDETMMNIAITVEELNGMNVKKLRMTAQAVGLKGYSHMKKAELVKALKAYTIGSPSQYRRGEVDHIYTSTSPVNPLDDESFMDFDEEEYMLNIERTDNNVNNVTVNANNSQKEDKEMAAQATTNVTDNKAQGWDKLVKGLVKEILFQTLPSKNGKLVLRKENGNLVLQKWALFYRPTKKNEDNQSVYLVMGSRLWGVVSKVIAETYSKSAATNEHIEQTIDKMVELGMLTKVATERTYVTLSKTEMSQDEKEQMNALWKSCDINTVVLKDGKIKATAVSDKGKVVLNQLYPCWTYRATAAQLNKMYVTYIKG